MRTTLLTAVRTTVTADSDPIRRALFERLRKTSRPVRAAAWLHQRFGRGAASSLVVAMYGIKSWLTLSRDPGPSGHLVAVAVHANARRRIAQVAHAYGAQHVSHLRTGTPALSRPAGFSTRAARNAFRLVRRINARHSFLVSCRVASLLGCYLRSTQLLAGQRPLGVLVSSDSNPEEVGLAAAARSLSLPTIFAPHAHTTSVSPRLHFSLSILESQAALDAYVRKGPVTGAVFIAGVDGISRPMDPARLRRPEPAIGFFAPKVVAWPEFARMIDDCREHFRARHIVIRWHPSMIDRPRLATVLTDASHIVETPATSSLMEVTDMCDWVVADAASNVHVQVLKLGVPTVAVSGIGFLPGEHADMYGFVANRLVFPPVPRLRALAIDDVERFYGAEWSARFQRYDASYMRPEPASDAQLADAIRAALAGGRPV